MKARLTSLAFGRRGESLLTLSTSEDCGGLFDELRGFDVDVTIKKSHKRRSLDANAYAWVLMDKLAAATGIRKEDVYRDAVRNLGGNTETVCVRDKAVEKLCETWGKNGLGWFAETTKSKLDGCTNVILYYGSSTFDTSQMSRLIDNLIQDCKAVGIETMPPDELKALMEGWT